MFSRGARSLSSRSWVVPRPRASPVLPVSQRFLASEASPAASPETPAESPASESQTSKPESAPSTPEADPTPAPAPAEKTPARPAASTASRTRSPNKSGLYASNRNGNVPRSAVKAATPPLAAQLPAGARYVPHTIRAPSSDQRSAAAARGATANEIDWPNSYYGISAKAVSKDQFQALMKPLDVVDIEVKPDGVIYLPEIKYRRRLNEVFGPMGWGMIPKGEPAVGESIVTREYALVAEGRFVSQAQGENSYFGIEQLPSSVEGCKSNALMRCCKDLGIASELWDPIFIRWYKKSQMTAVWVEHVTTKKKRQFWFKKDQVEVSYPYKLSQK